MFFNSKRYKPAPKENEVLVKIHAAAITAGDLIFVKGEPFLARLGPDS